VSITLVVVSTAPNNISALGLRQSANDVGVNVIFQNPDFVGGAIVCDYTGAYFNVTLYGANRTILRTTNVEYIDTLNQVYESNFQDVAYSSSYTIEIFLVTFDGNCDPINGITGSVSFTAGYKPLIYSINDAPPSQWDQQTPVVKLVIFSFTMLNDVFSTVIINNSVGPDFEVNMYNVLINGNYTITSVTNSYDAFEGAYEYTFSSIEGPNSLAIALCACNEYGATPLPISGSVQP
jgi:hypothetical protein